MNFEEFKTKLEQKQRERQQWWLRITAWPRALPYMLIHQTAEFHPFILPPLCTISSPLGCAACSVYLDLLQSVLASYLRHPSPSWDPAALPVAADSIFPPRLAGARPSSSHPPKKHSAKAYQTLGVAHDVFYFWDVFLDL